MIQKFLVVGRQVYFASNRSGLDQEENIRVVELQMPIQNFWDAEKLLKEADYLIASSEDGITIKETYRKFFKIVAPYAIDEKDKAWVFEKGGVRPI